MESPEHIVHSVRCQVFADLVETPETTAPLLTADGSPVVGKAEMESRSTNAILMYNLMYRGILYINCKQQGRNNFWNLVDFIMKHCIDSCHKIVS